MKYKRHCNNCNSDFFCNGKCKSDRTKSPNDCYCLKCVKKISEMAGTKEALESFNVVQFHCQESGREEVQFT